METPKNSLTTKLSDEGEKLMLQGSFKEAIEKFQKVIDLEEKDFILKSLAALNSGVCYGKLKNIEKSLEYTEKSIEFFKKASNLPSEEPKNKGERENVFIIIMSNPLGVQAYLNKGIILEAMGRLEEARKVFDDLINFIQPRFYPSEQRFRQERLILIAKMAQIKEGKLPEKQSIFLENVKNTYKNLGYSDEEIQKDIEATTGR